MSKEMDKPVLHSGGATGADTAWAHRAFKQKHHVKVYSFDGHKRTRLIDDEGHYEVITLDDTEEQLVNMALEQASKHLGKKMPSFGYTRNLLKRNYNIIRNVDRLYAVGFFDETSSSSTRLRIQGGTAWTMEMFLDILLSKDPSIHRNDCMLPMYFYSQDQLKWYQLHHTIKDNFRWVSLSIDDPPKPEGNYAGIGSRDLTQDGDNAIRNL